MWGGIRGRLQAMRCDTDRPSRVIRFSTAQPTRASIFWAGSVRARRPRPMTVGFPLCVEWRVL